MRTFTQLTPWVDHLVSSTADVPPPRWDLSVFKHCTITSDLTHLPRSDFDSQRRTWHSNRYFSARYELVMGVRGGVLSVALEYRGHRYGVGNVDFDAN